MQVGKKVNDFLIDLYFWGKSKVEVPERIANLVASHPAIATLVTSIVPLLAPQQIVVPVLTGYMFLQFLGGKEKAESLSEKELEEKFDEFKKYLKDISKDLENMKSYVEACGIDYLPRTLNLVNQDNKDKDIEDFLKGLKPTWNVIMNSIDIKRNKENEIIEKLKDNKNVLLLGNSGSGKSVLLKRLAYDLMKDCDVFFSTGTVDSTKAIEFIKEYSSVDKKTIIIIDNILAYKNAVKDLIERVRDIALNVNFVLSEQTEKWQEESFSTLNFETVKITLDEETKKQYIGKYSEIKHKTFSREEQEDMISASRDVFPILVLLTSGEGKSLGKAIEDMYKAIEKNEKEIMKAILFSASYDVEIPEELIRSVYNDGEIINNLNGKGLIRIGNSLISTQHPYIAERILKDKFRLNNADEEGIIDNLIKVEDKKEYFNFFFLLGTRMAEDKKNSAESLLKKAIRINPNDAEAHNNLGNLLDDLKRYDEAEKEFRKALKIKPNFAEAHYNLGNLLVELHHYDEAEKEYREAIRIKPNYSEAYDNLGNLLKDLKRYDEAEREFREAIRINPNDADTHNNLGSLLMDLKRYDEAEREYRKAIRIKPDDANAYYNLGTLLAQFLHHYDEAEKEFREATRINPADADAYINLGNLLVELHHYDEAEKEYREAIKINPDIAEAHYNLGNLLLIIGRKDEAKQEILKARELFEKQERSSNVKKCGEILKGL